MTILYTYSLFNAEKKKKIEQANIFTLPYEGNVKISLFLNFYQVLSLSFIHIPLEKPLF